ncbi:MAG: hypothetical protein J6D61_04505 [Clostridia bacterium]|nr:hypothetical protein [Clostridia bacterium]
MKNVKDWIRENDAILRVLSLLMAIGLWGYVMSTEDVEKALPYEDIPVRLEGVTTLKESGLVVMSGTNETVSVKASGKSSLVQEVKKDYLNLITATASVAHITEPGEYKLSYQLVKDSVAEDVTLSDKSPSQITVVIDRMNTASIPVEVELVGEMASGLSLDSVNASPDAIVVRGPETILRQIKKAKVTYDISGVTTTMQTNVTYTLLDGNGEAVTSSYLTPDTPSTMLSLSLRQQGAVPLTVALKDSTYLKSYMVDAKIDPASINLIGDPDLVRELNGIELEAVDLSEVLEEGTMEFARVIQLPDGVSLASGQKQFAMVKITLDGCGWETRELDQTHLPEDSLLIYPEQQIKIDVFGSTTALARLRDSDIVLEPIYELDDLVVGTNTLPCRITLQNSSIYVKQELEITVEVTQEALDAALNPEPVDPDAPDQPNE